MRTSFKIGGNADIAVFPETEAQLLAAVAALRGADVRFMLIGNGTNLLFSDKGYRGAVIITKKMRKISVDGNILSVLCGDSFTEAAVAAKDASLTGLEFAYGIPGSCGGAVCMNAGAYGGEVSGVLLDMRVLDTASGEVFTVSKADADFSYRHSVIRDFPNYAVISARFALRHGDKNEINAYMQDIMGRRRDKQPLEYPSAGSVFKRPAPDMYVGKMLEDLGLKGFTIGGAQVSQKHAGFIINVGGATASDVLALVDHIKKAVLAAYSVELECEICAVSEE
ncbi:MAG: UDP-N-acetylmuramate dehydrogenase [Clostridia bacterium]|nr:UDP-N-acetylmuramate dehydrogenase [Clostridia bacterium]